MLRTSAFHRFPFRYQLFLRLGVACVLLCATAAPSRADRGLWTALQDLDPGVAANKAVHLALVRGDNAPFHSRVVWLGHDGYDGHATEGGVLGWLPGNDDCSALPLSTMVKLGTGWDPGADNFCSGHATLASGELITVGGSDRETQFGTNDARTYNPESGSLQGSWAARAPMHYARFYPTATLLKDGRLLSSWGARYRHLWCFGGRREGAAPDNATGHLLYRTGRGTGATWEPPVTPEALSPSAEPSPRYGHTAVALTQNSLPGMAVFGGRNGNGSIGDGQVHQMYRENGQTLDADYGYKWQRIDPTNQPPAGRAEHIAASLSASQMVVFGGIKLNGADETPTGEFLNLWKDAGPNWTWIPVTVNSGTPPTARYGHASVYEGSNRRLYIYGGSEQMNQPPSDNKVYYFEFDPVSNGPVSGSWHEVWVAGGPAPTPAPRRDHIVAYDASIPALLVYGGYLNGAAEDADLWKLDLSPLPSQPAVWSIISTSGNSPGARVGHAAYYDDLSFYNGGRLTVFGGEHVTGGPCDANAYTIEPFAPGGAMWKKGPATTANLSQHTVLLENAGGLTMSPVSETYNPDPSANSWTDTNAGYFQSNKNVYPLHFVVPGAAPPGGGRVLAAGPDPVTRYLDINTSGQAPQGWQILNPNGSGFEPLTGATYLPGKVMIAGGVELPTSSQVVTGLTKTLDVTNPASGWQPSAAMEPRYHHNLVLLPTGEVLAMGGVTTTIEDGLACCGVKTPQLWTPSAGGGTWSSVAQGAPDRLTPDDAVRNYHSAALLLPDGRVLSGGGNRSGFENTTNIFCPPYLFQANGTPATRPLISSVPGGAIPYGQSFLVGTPTPGSITSVCLMRPGATTHSFDQNQRYVPLAFSSIGTSTLRAIAPPSGSYAPPGDYLLFILSGSGVPAIAQWVRLGNCPGIPCDVDPPPNVADLSPDIVGPNEIWLAWTAPGDDRNPALGVYDLRFSTAPITTEDAFAAASPMPVSTGDQTPPAPGAAGWPQTCTKFSLAACTPYYFALKTRDGTNNWSALSALSTSTTCGGAGGGYSARRSREEGSEEGLAAPTVPAARAVVAAGADNREHAAAAADLGVSSGVLVAETRRAPGGGWQVTLRMVAEAEGLDPSLKGMVVSQVQDTFGAWKTLGRYQVSPDQNPLGLCALRDQGRLVFPGGYALDRVATGLEAGSPDLSLNSANHSGLGEIGGAALTADGGVQMALGDVLTINYAPSASAVAGATGWYLTVRSAGTGTEAPAHRVELPTIPTQFKLHPGQPNPTQGSTRITFDLPVPSAVTMEVFDLLGRKVTTLMDGQRPAGSHVIEWDLRDATGATVRPGVYVCRMAAGEFLGRTKLSVLP